MHVVVANKTGAITGFDVDVAGQRTSAVIEDLMTMSKHPNAKTLQGNSTLLNVYLQTQNKYIGAIVTQRFQIGVLIYLQVLHLQQLTSIVDALTGGTDDYVLTNGELSIAYNKFDD